MILGLAQGLYVRSVAADSAPIIDLLIAENGGPLADHEWYTHREAQATFDGENDVAFDRFEPIDGGALHRAHLQAGVLTLGLALLVLRLVARRNAADLPGPVGNGLLAGSAVAVLVLIVPLVAYQDTIAAVGSIVE